MRRPHIDWMTRADDAILEFLLNDGNRPVVATPGVIEANLDYGISHVRARLRELHRAELVGYVDADRGLYQITERGKSYLRGQLEEEALQRTESDE